MLPSAVAIPPSVASSEAEEGYLGMQQAGDREAAAAAAAAAAAPPHTPSAAAAGEPRLLVIAGPSGVGKGTLVKKLRQHWPKAFGFSVSHTSRSPRQGERFGVDYYFVTRSQIEEMNEKRQLVEWAEFSNHLYATSKGEIQRISALGQICLLEVELMGVASLRKFGFSCARYVFIQPPSLEELERRLRYRNTETPDAVERRLSRAKEEVEAAKLQDWDLVLINDDVDEAWQSFKSHIADWFDLP